MATVPFSLRLDSSIKAQLEKEAKEHDRSASYIVVRAIKSYLQAAKYKKKAIDDAVKQADKGVFVSQKAMGSWVESWGNDYELDKPESDISSDR